MRVSSGLTIAAACCTAVLASACSDSTSPNHSSDAARLALHFDSLYVEAASLAPGSDNYAERALLLSFIEAGAAYGALPAAVDVTTANGSEQWNAYEVEDIEPNGESGIDTVFLMVAYRESDAHTIALAEYDPEGAIFGGEILTNDSLAIEPAHGDGVTELASSGGDCATPSSSLLNTQIATLADFACSQATFNTSLTLLSDADPNVDPALTSISFPTMTINGEFFSASQADAATVHRLRALLRKHMAGKRL